MEGKENAQGQNKEYNIIVNSRDKVWNEKNISYNDLVILAFGSISNDPNVIYTITFKKGDNNKPEGTMVKGESIKVKDGMRFNVTQTSRS